MRIDRSIFGAFDGLRLGMPGKASGLRQGDRRSPYRGRGVEFADYRPYDPGDDMRLIDWNVYARLETVLVRLFHEDRNLTVAIYVDASASMAFGDPRKIDHAGELAACLALIGLRGRDSVTVASFGAAGVPRRATGHNFGAFPALLRTLESIEPDAPGAARERSLARASARQQVASLVGHTRADRAVLLSDMLVEDAERESLLRALAAAGRRPVLMHVLSSDELAPDLSAGSRLVDAETGEELLIRDGKAALRAYQDALAAWVAALERRCVELGVQYVPAHTTVAARALALGNLRKGRLVESAYGGVA